MLISTTNLIETRKWWTYGSVKKYLLPKKKIKGNNFYSFDDIIVIEKMEQIKILKRYVSPNMLVRGDIEEIRNIVRLIHVSYPKEIDLPQLVKKMRSHLKSIKNKFNNSVLNTKQIQNKNSLLAHIRHKHTNYEEIIYHKLDDLVKECDIDKNLLIKELKSSINVHLLKRFPEVRSWKG